MASKKITPHVLRHTTAMRMLAAGIDITTIALWLGHESPRSTHPYPHADLQLKQRCPRPHRPTAHHLGSPHPDRPRPCLPAGPVVGRKSPSGARRQGASGSRRQGDLVPELLQLCDQLTGAGLGIHTAHEAVPAQVLVGLPGGQHVIHDHQDRV
ncbi:MAG: tyrosine-type recombinase/integrase, partial [Stenotrophomonas sp.]|uniref:tyrosine-type recombinase/integrase n=1 Tax=Stenotrophomonas sp. TaxID=69392 RepID=UPI003D6CD46B